MVGGSAALEKVWDAIRRAAPTNATVLITGESGVGKELVARAIHRNSPARDEAFVQVNCAAIPEELIESELFGHEKGSFTGATEKQIGKFELAHKGTIFLDEVGDMSLRTQAKVLRVLQEGEVERIGSQKTIQVDVRVIAATNKNLEEEIAQGRFREDLFFRLSVIPIRVPPLRERPEDIPPLVEHFVRQFCAENNVRRRGFTPAAIEALGRHPWRGNVRELKNAIERLLIMVEDDQMEPEHLADVLRRPAEEPAGGRRPRARSATSRRGPSAPSSSRSCARTRWNISATATAIGTPRSNLYKKLERTASPRRRRVAAGAAPCHPEAPRRDGSAVIRVDADARRSRLDGRSSCIGDQCYPRGVRGAGRAIAAAVIGRGGKSGLHRAACWLTASGGDPRESATENTPPNSRGKPRGWQG